MLDASNQLIDIVFLQILGPTTTKIEWSQLDRGKHLVQELKEEQPQPPPEDYWYGYRGDLKAKPAGDT